MNQKRNVWIDIMRCLASMTILLNHLNSLQQPYERVSLICCYGFLGVEFFFVISGCLMAAKAEGQKEIVVGKATWQFIGKKIRGLFPYCFVAWCIAFISDCLLNNFSIKENFVHLIEAIPTFFYLEMAGYPVYQVNTPTWYLSGMILGMFIIFPMLIKWKKNFSLVVAPVAAIGIYGYLSQKVGNLATIGPLGGGSILWIT